MLKRVLIANSITLLVLLVMLTVFVGCTADKGKFDVSGITNEESACDNILNTVEDIEKVVTDDDKLVINYFDAYTWIVYFDTDGYPLQMVYIYKFDDEIEASKMTSVRRSELEKNRTMNVYNCRCVGEYVIAELTDSSFADVSREILENNFSGLIVY